MYMTTTYRIKGIKNDETTCACCGRNDLTKVVWLAPLDEDGNEFDAAPYGTTCAARLMTPKTARSTSTTLAKIAKAVDYIARWDQPQVTLDALRNAVGVKFNVWASVEGNTLSINTPSGWVAVLAR